MALSRDHKNALYTAAGRQQNYLYKSGLEPCPVAGADGETLFVRVHAPTSGRVDVFCFARVGQMVQVPRPTPLDANEVLLSAHLKVSQPAPDGMGPSTFRVEGEYHYGHRRAIVPGTDALPVGTMPCDAFAPAAMVLRPDQFDQRPLPRSNKADVGPAHG